MVHSKSQDAYVLIRERIASGEFLPGHRLVLAQLATDLDMSVVPVREAIRRLEAEGIVVYQKNVGARVAAINHEEYLGRVQALAIVEGAATALTAPGITAERLAEARAKNDEIIQLFDNFDPDAYAKLNHEFHALLYVDCPNHTLREMVDDGWSRVVMVRDPSNTFTADRAYQSTQEHEHILSLIERGAEGFEIEFAVREHRSASRFMLAHTGLPND